MSAPIFSSRIWLYVFILSLTVLAACSRLTPPTPSEVPNLPAGWNQITPAGETVCANGSEYAFFVNPGTVNKLVVDFEGGGACWNGGTCSQPQNPGNNFEGLYFEGVYGSPEDLGFGGIYDRENPANPFKDWYHVHISYCTADLHLGDNTATYSGPDGKLTVNHKGAVNARAALGWVFDNFSAPETVFVTGVSAGAYASIVWLPEIADSYPKADIYQLGDSGAGIVTESFFSGDAVNWRIEGALPDLGEPVPLDETILTALYNGVGQNYPDAVLSQYNSLFDGTQIGFYGLMQGISPPTQELSLEWSQMMTASLAAISGKTDTFRSYFSTFDVDADPANGTTHVILSRPEVYTLETSGMRFVDWLGDLVSGRDVESVSPEDKPASALGDGPTLTGTIADVADSKLSDTVLTIKLGAVSGPMDVLVQAPVAADGSFSVQLPGEAEVTPYLFGARPTLFGPGPEECDLSISPAAYKTLGTPEFALYSDGQLVDRLLHTSDPNSNFVYYVYVDRDVTIMGACTEGESAGFTLDIDMRKGWNSVVVDFAVLEIRSEKPIESYRWLLPFCTFGCSE